MVGYGLTIYGYSKIIIMGYRYSQKLISKFQEQQIQNRIQTNSKLVTEQAQFLIIAMYSCPSVQTIRFISTVEISQLENI